MSKLSASFLSNNVVSAINVFDHFVEVRSGARSYRFDGVEGDLSAMFTGKVVDNRRHPAQPVAKPIEAPKPIEGPKPVLAMHTQWSGLESDEEIAAYLAPKLDALIGGDLLGAMQREVQRHKDRRNDKTIPESPFRTLLNEAIKTWKVNGTRVYMALAAERGILMSVSSEGLPTHQYKDTVSSLTPKVEKPKKASAYDAMALSEGLRKATEGMAAPAVVEALENERPMNAALKRVIALYEGGAGYKTALEALNVAEKAAFVILTTPHWA